MQQTHASCIVCHVVLASFFDLLQVTFFRKGTEDDYFGNEEFRKIVYASNPQLEDKPQEEMDEDNNHNDIRFMTAPMLAFAELKVLSAISMCFLSPF